MPGTCTEALRSFVRLRSAQDDRMDFSQCYPERSEGSDNRYYGVSCGAVVGGYAIICAVRTFNRSATTKVT